MALFYLIRHGQPDYSHLAEHGFFGFGRAFAPLSGKGIEQAEATAKDERLKSAGIIVSSPYTRALQTAQIISKHTGLDVTVELDLHEWEPDFTNTYTTSEESFALSRDFAECRGVYPAGETRRWETLAHMRERMRRVADKYADREKVIFVGHGMAFRALTYIEKMDTAEIIECPYEIGQPDCEYSFT